MLVPALLLDARPAGGTAEPDHRRPATLGPVAAVASTDGSLLFVAAADAKQILVVDTKSRTVIRSIGVPASPTGMVLAPSGNALYVTCAAPKSTVCVIDVASQKVRTAIPARHTATGLAISPDGSTLYVCNRFSNTVSVIDASTGTERVAVPTTREPVGAVITPDGASVFVINHLPNDRADAFDVAAEITVIETSANRPSTVRLSNGSMGLRGLCVSPDGKYVFVVHILARYQTPVTQLDRGWTITNAMSILDAAGKKLITTVLLDDVDLGAANPWGVATTADGSTLCVTHAGTHEISIIDAKALMEKVLALPGSGDAIRATGDTHASLTLADVRNDLAFLVGLRRRVNLGDCKAWDQRFQADVIVNGPRGLAVVGNRAYVASYFTDNLAVVDLRPGPGRTVSTIALGPEPTFTLERRGERLFHDADICFQKWLSCASCHPDGRVDGLNWDLMNDGVGNPKNARSMLLAHRTPPAMASVVRATAEEGVRAGIRHILFAVRREADAAAIDAYAKSLKPLPSPLLVNGSLSPAAERGKKLFFDEKIGCGRCHPEPLYTDLRSYDVGSRHPRDQRGSFDTPSLIECWRTSPYMHDGRYITIEELLTRGRHGYKGTSVDKLDKQQLSDLIEFVLSL